MEKSDLGKKEATKIMVSDTAPLGKKDKLKAFLHTKKGKVVCALLALLLIVAVLLAIPSTRYSILGSVMKKDVVLTIQDTDSKKPVSGATVKLGSVQAVSDAKGRAKLSSVPVGEYTLSIEKKYYTSLNSPYTVPVIASPTDSKPVIKATGRAVVVTVINKITAFPVAGAKVSISESVVTTDEKGIASIILPVKSGKQTGKATSAQFVDAPVELEVKNADDQKLTVQLTPNGSLYYLSKRTGKINVMKSNLDGSGQQVVVDGTGKETDASTVLLSTTDWKYQVLQASRDSEKPKLYLLNDGKLSVIDEGNAEFQLVGWSGHQFVYTLLRQTPSSWDTKRQALKSFNAETGKLTTLDETIGSGSNQYDFAYESLGNSYILNDTVIYTKTWDTAFYTNRGDKTHAIMKVGINGQNKSRVKDFPANEWSYFEGRLYESDEIYFRATLAADGKAKYFEYEDGKIAETGDTNDQKFYNTYYPTYLESPSGQKLLWYEPRDGKNVIFVSDKGGDNAREIGVSDYVPYGWQSDDYLLFSHKGSELYVLGQKGSINDSLKPMKVTDYHKAQLFYPGYGKGYGGQ